MGSEEMEVEVAPLDPEQAIPEDYNPKTDEIREGAVPGVLVALRRSETEESVLLDGNPPSLLEATQADEVAERVAMAEDDLARVTYALKIAKKDGERRVARLRGWYGPALTAWVQEKIQGRKPRRHVTESGVICFLRKLPDKGQLQNFAKLDTWDSKNQKAGLVKRTAGWSDLTWDEMHELQVIMPHLSPGLQKKFEVMAELRKRKLAEYVKDTGEIPDGTEIEQGKDKAYFEYGPPRQKQVEGPEDAQD